MVGITHKNTTLRIAIAEAIVHLSSENTMQAILQGKVSKGDVFEMSKTAGLFGVKRTSDMIPDCHPLPVEYTAITFETEGLDVKIRVEVHTIYRTGVEVEAMHGASVVALTMYDMLKPIDKGVEIRNIRLIEKTGGKSDWKKYVDAGIQSRVVVCSDTISKGLKEDFAGKMICSKLESYGLSHIDYRVIPDEKDVIEVETLKAKNEGLDLLIFTGGTGLSIRDVTPEAIIPLLERRIPGIEETIRDYGQQRTPLSMMSRSVAGTIGKTLVIALPGSTKGAEESMDAIFPSALHVFKVFKGTNHGN